MMKQFISYVPFLLFFQISLLNAQMDTLFFVHNNQLLQSGSTLSITEIGLQPEELSQRGSTVVCVTNNVNTACCSPVGSVVGNWRGPDGNIIPYLTTSFTGDTFTSVPYTSEIRLSRVPDVLQPTGRYICEVPRQGNQRNITASINIEDAPSTQTTPTMMVESTTLPSSRPTTTSTQTMAMMTTTTGTISTSSATKSPSSPDTSKSETTPTGEGSAKTNSNPTTEGGSGDGSRASQGNATSRSVVTAVVVVVMFLGMIAIAGFILLICLCQYRRRVKRSKYSLDEYVTFRKSEYVSPLLPLAKQPLSFNKQESFNIPTATTNNIAPAIEVFPEATTAEEGEEVYFKVRVSGIPKPTVMWTFKQQTIESDYSREIEDTGSITFPSCELSQTGTYTMVASNSSGEVKRLVTLTVYKEGEGPQGDMDKGDAANIEPLPVSEFGEYVARLHSNNNKLFKAQFTALDKGSKSSCAVSEHPDNQQYNRFGNILVYDDNRVILRSSPKLSSNYGDYINASYINGYSVPKKFIATQGPMANTLVAFWHMIWQERPSTIVMVTNLVEGGKDKCMQYWPNQGSMDVGPFTITVTGQQVLADYAIRTFIVKLSSSSSAGHKVCQYHFTSWPDHGVPDYASPLLTFHRRVSKEHHSNRGPMICHCSAGVGRTGTFIGLDNILEQARKEGVVDVVGVIKKMREQRMHMVQAMEQFAFLHDAVLESLICGDTQISASNLITSMHRLGKVLSGTQTTGYDHEFKVLEQVSPHPEDAMCSWARRFPQLNRNSDFLPVDRWRVGLKNEYTSYLHATFANGYKQQRAFIIAQTPLPASIRNLWKVIYDSNVSAIVQLTKLQEEGVEVCSQYWPKKNGQLKTLGDFEVDHVSEDACSGFIVRQFRVIELKSQAAHEVTQFHVTDWKGNGECSDMEAVTNVMEEVSKLQRRTGNHPIMVICNDTVTRSAMFCCIYNTIERCKLEGVVDVFQAVKSLRIHRPGAIQTVDQYKAIFEALLLFLDSFSDYSNFM